MADIARRVGLNVQLRLIAVLHWRSLINGIARYGGWTAIVLGGLAGAIIIIPYGLWCGVAAYRALAGGRPEALGVPLWTLFAVWQVAPVLSAAGETGFDVRSLLRFPVGLPALYVIGLASGLLGLGAVMSAGALVGMGWGVAAARPELLPVWGVIAIAYVFMNLTLERLCTAWLQRLLAKRWTREILLGLLALSGFGAQFVGRWIAGGRLASWLQQPSLQWSPPALAARGMEVAAAMDGGTAWPYAAALAGYAVVLGALLWKRLAVQSRGEDLSEAAAPTARTVRRPVGRALPDVLPSRIGLVFRKELRSIVRTPRVLFGLLAGPLFVAFVMGRDIASPDTVFPLMAGYVFSLSSLIIVNCFAPDGTGVQTYFVAPIRFTEIFVGKNLFSAAMVATEVLLCAGMFVVRSSLPSLPVLTSVSAALVFGLAAVLPMGNRLSLTHPSPLGPRSGGVGLGHGAAALPWYGMMAVLWIVGTLAFMSGGWTGHVWLPAEIFGVLAAGALIWYADALDSVSELAEEKREVLLDALCRQS